MTRTMLVWTLALIVLALAGGGIAADTPAPADPKVMTMATAYGLNRSQIASFDAALAGRLVRFGKVAQGRGRYLEAKRFFWQALLVDPTSTIAWLSYDQAVILSLGRQVERMPGLVGLDGLADEPGDAKPVEPEVLEGC